MESEACSRLGRSTLVLAGFVAGVTLVTNCGGGGGSSSAAPPGVSPAVVYTFSGATSQHVPAPSNAYVLRSVLLTPATAGALMLQVTAQIQSAPGQSLAGAAAFEIRTAAVGPPLVTPDIAVMGEGVFNLAAAVGGLRLGGTPSGPGGSFWVRLVYRNASGGAQHVDFHEMRIAVLEGVTVEADRPRFRFVPLLGTDCVCGRTGTENKRRGQTRWWS